MVARKRLLLLTLALILIITLVLIGCSNSGTTTTDQGQSGGTETSGSSEGTQATESSGDVIKLRLGWAPGDITGFFKMATNYMEEAVENAKAGGIEIELITRSATDFTRPEEQVEAIENFIQNDVDAIIVCPSDVDVTKKVFGEVNAAGIPLIITNMMEPIEGVNVDTFVGYDNFIAGEINGYAMLDALGGPGVMGEGEMVNTDPAKDILSKEWWENVYKDVDKSSISGEIAHLEGIAGSYSQQKRGGGFLNVVENYPNVKIVSTLSADWNREKGMQAGENILQNYPDIDGIYCQNIEMAMGAANAANNVGRNDIIILSQDGTPESCDEIRKGTLTAEAWIAGPSWGVMGVAFATMAALGQEVPEFYDINLRTMYLGNIDNFFPEPMYENIKWDAIADAYRAGATKADWNGGWMKGGAYVDE